MIRVLFVCLGNICRSPMAEAIFRAKVKAKGLQDLIDVDSAGTGSWHIGSPPHQGTRKILESYQIDYQGINARQVSKKDVIDFTYIIAMDEQNKRDLVALFGGDHQNKIIKLLDYLPDSMIKDVPDPYFTGNFEEVYNLLNTSCDRLLQEIIHTHDLE